MSRTWLTGQVEQAGQEPSRRPGAVSSAAGPEDGVEQSATAVHLLSGREVVDSALAAPWPPGWWEPGRKPLISNAFTTC